MQKQLACCHIYVHICSSSFFDSRRQKTSFFPQLIVDANRSAMREMTVRVQVCEFSERGAHGRFSSVALQRAEPARESSSRSARASAGTSSGLRPLSSWYCVSRLFSGRSITSIICDANHSCLGARKLTAKYHASVSDADLYKKNLSHMWHICYFGPTAPPTPINGSTAVPNG